MGKSNIVISSMSRQWAGASRQWQPPTDVFESAHTVVVRMEIAGMRDSEFTISLEGRVLVIKGLRTDSPEPRAYQQMEIPFGEFFSIVELPCPVVSERVEADYSDGFLRVVLPKARPTTVDVE